MKMWQMLCAAAIVSPAMGDLVVNGGFEAGTGEDADGWNQLEIFGGSASASTDRVCPLTLRLIAIALPPLNLCLLNP